MSLSDRNPYEVHAELLQRVERLERAILQRDDLRRALVQIENWVDKPPSNMGEAHQIFEYIRQACSVLDQN